LAGLVDDRWVGGQRRNCSAIEQRRPGLAQIREQLGCAMAASVLVNLGENYDDPMQDKRLKYPAAGQLLIHELCHAWQIKQTTFLPGLMCDAIVAHSGDFIGPKRDIYTAQPGNDWSTYGMEQQAFLVDSWFGEGMLTTSNKFRYIENNIRMAAG